MWRRIVWIIEWMSPKPLPAPDQRTVASNWGGYSLTPTPKYVVDALRTPRQRQPDLRYPAS